MKKIIIGMRDYGIPNFSLKMKLTSIFLFITLFQIQANTFSQNAKVTLDLKEVSLISALSEIEKKTDHKFLYEKGVLVLDKIVSIYSKNEKLSSILNRLLQGENVDIVYLEKQIVIKPKIMLPSPKGEQKNKQQQEVSGKISDQNGLPLLGVTVLIKGTSSGTSSDFDGNYTLTVDKQSTLVFSYVGFRTMEVLVNSQSVINVTLVQDNEELNEVIITALGESRSVKSLGYAVSNIKGSDLSETSENNVIDALSGKVAGLDISTGSGGVGSSSRIILRGVKTVGSNSDQPLFVIDGVPVDNTLRAGARIDYGNSIADFNPDDIAEITVLKSAAAAALYGSAGANGVIVIKTKSGIGNKNLGVEYSSSLTISNPLKLIDYQNEYGPGSPGSDWNYYDRIGGSNGWGNAFGIQETAIQWNSPLNSEGNLVALPLKAYSDNGKEFFNTGITRDMSIAIAKSEKDKYNFRLALRNIHEDGMVPTTELTRNSISFSAGTNITEKLRANVNLIYSNQDSPNRVTTQNWSDNPLRQALLVPRHVDVRALKNYRGLLANGVPLPFDVIGEYPQVVAPGWEANNGDYFPNPFFTLNNVKNEYSNNRMFAVANLIYDINDWLSIDTKVSKEFISEKQEIKRNQGVRLWTGSFYSYQGSYYRTSYTRNNTFANALLKGKGKIGSFGFNGILGVETRDFILDGAWQNAPEIELPNLFTISNVVGDPQGDQYYIQTRTNSAYASLDIDYKSLVYLSLTGRNDWNSTLPKSNRSFFYPSASLSFILSDIVNLPEVFSFMKLRGNAGMVGIGAGAYQIHPTLDTQTRLPNVFEATISNSLNNPTLKPTRTTTYEVGADIRFFEGRLNFDIAGYVGKSIDQIQRVNLPGSTGYSNRIINAGDIENKGIELAVKAIPIEGDFTWDLGFTYSKNRNKVLSLADGVEELLIASRYSNIRTVARPGQPYGQLMGNGLKRDPNGNVIHNNGNVVQTDQQIVLGNVTPDWLGNFTTSMRYKGFSLSAQVSAKIGGDMFSLTNQWAAGDGLTKSTLTPYRDGSIIGKGVMQLSDGSYVPNNVSVSYQQYVQNLMRWGLHEPVVYDASYVKLRSVQLYYTFPQKVMERLPFQSIKVGIVGRNLALLYSKAPNFDPEAAASARNSDQGFDEFNMPTARSFTFNLTFKF